MISALHLIWTVPVCIFMGMIVMGFFVSVNKSNRESDIYEEGIREGLRIANAHTQTLKEYIIDKYDNNVESFITSVSGFIYGVEDSGQMIMIFLDNGEDLFKYKNCEIISISEGMGISRPVIKT